MGIIDIIIIAVLVIGFISGLQKGFITSLLACAALFGAFLIAGALEGRLYTAFMGTNLQKWLSRNLDATEAVWSNLYHVLSYVVVVILAYCALMLIVNDSRLDDSSVLEEVRKVAGKVQPSSDIREDDAEQQAIEKAKAISFSACIRVLDAFESAAGSRQ